MTDLATARLVLDALALEDARDLFAVRGDPEAMAFWDWPADPNPEATVAVVAEMIREASAASPLKCSGVAPCAFQTVRLSDCVI